jgi:hypothetical protein
MEVARSPTTHGYCRSDQSSGGGVLVGIAVAVAVGSGVFVGNGVSVGTAVGVAGGGCVDVGLGSAVLVGVGDGMGIQFSMVWHREHCPVGCPSGLTWHVLQLV